MKFFLFIMLLSFSSAKICGFNQDSSDSCVLISSICALDIYYDDNPEKIANEFLDNENIQILKLKGILIEFYQSEITKQIKEVNRGIKNIRKSIKDLIDILVKTKKSKTISNKKNEITQLKKILKENKNEEALMTKEKKILQQQETDTKNVINNLQNEFAVFKNINANEESLEVNNTITNLKKKKIFTILKKLLHILLKLFRINNTGTFDNFVSKFFDFTPESVTNFQDCSKLNMCCIATYYCFDEMELAQLDTINDLDDLGRLNKLTGLAKINHSVYIPHVNMKENELIAFDQQNNHKLDVFTWSDKYKLFQMKIEDGICLVIDAKNLCGVLL